MSVSQPTWSANDKLPGISWWLLLGAACLGGLVAFLSYGFGESFGAGIALALVLTPLLLTSSQRAPQFFLALLAALTAINCFGFLTENAIIFRLLMTCAIAGMAMRFALFDAVELRPLLLLCGLLLVGTLVTVLNKPSLEATVLAVMWLSPFLGIFTGAGLLRRYPEQTMTTWYLIASACGIAIATVNLYQWLASGLVLESYVITGPFANANVTGSMLGFFVPIYLAMTQHERARTRLAGWGMFALAVLALVILVSRTALGLALAAPVLFFLRGRPLLVIGLLLFMAWFGWLQTGMVSMDSLNLPDYLEKPLETYRMKPVEGETPRVLSYGIGGLAIMANPIDGYGFGSGKTIMLASGHESYGPENLWMRNWLEGGLWLFVPTVLFYGWALLCLYGRGIWISSRLHPFTYALILSCLMSFMYYLFNGAQTHQALRNMEGMALGTLALLLTTRPSARKVSESTEDV